MWKVEMKEEDSIKEKEYLEGGGSENWEKNNVGTRTGLVAKFKRNIYKN